MIIADMCEALPQIWCKTAVRGTHTFSLGSHRMQAIEHSISAVTHSCTGRDFLSDVHFLDFISGQTYIDKMRMRKLDCKLGTVWRDCQVFDGVRKASGTRHMHVQPTVISRRREGVTKGIKLARSGRPPKRPLDDDPSAPDKAR